MQINGSRVLVLGGWGLVGAAICHKLMLHSPSCLIISSLNKAEAEEAVADLRKEYPNVNPEMFQARWGNIFTRTDWKDTHWSEVISDTDKRKGAIKDIFFELDDDMLKKSALYDLITETKPDVVIDCINTATAIAYLDNYNSAITTIKELDNGVLQDATAEKLMASVYIPQLIRHIQILYRGLTDAKSKMYLKIGTSGTGGMGFNIPYTHSEERPSRVLMSKTAVAGAQTLLLYILARTPDGPIFKEIKPTAAIAWKKIAYGPVKRKGREIPLVDMKPENAKPSSGKFVFDEKDGVSDTGDVFRSVFIDTGENGIFSRGEFQAISALGQMEIVTPEEIAEYAVFEILGGNTGRDVIQGLDAFTLGPTYRGGMLRELAVKKIAQLENENNVASVAFELLGPPRLSKLLYEANLLKRIVGSVNAVMTADVEDLSAKAQALIMEDSQLRSEMLSIGLAILLKDGKKYLRGLDVKIPVRRAETELDITPDNLEQWCFEGWVDLRPKNFVEWQNRFKQIKEQAEKVPFDETSSRYTYTPYYWENFENIDEGKIAGWVFEYEDKGWRFKR